MGTIGKIVFFDTIYKIVSSKLNFLVMNMVFWLCKRYLLKCIKCLNSCNLLSKVLTKVSVLNNIET